MARTRQSDSPYFLVRYKDWILWLIGIIFVAGMLYQNLQFLDKRVDRLEERLDYEFGKQ